MFILVIFFGYIKSLSGILSLSKQLVLRYLSTFPCGMLLNLFYHSVNSMLRDINYTKIFQ